MSLGISLITKESSISDSLRSTLLKHPFFNNPYSFKLQDTFINGQPESVYDSAVLQFLDEENIDYSDRLVEYWFQNNTAGLSAHCDYNFIYREKMTLVGNDWPHRVEKHLIVSPITIAAYLEVSDDMTGGELCISGRTWYEDKEPVSINTDFIKRLPHQTIIPKQGQVIYFKGSDHYHWVNRVITGSRKSMLINFWPKELLDK